MNERLKRRVSGSLVLLLGVQSFAWAPASYAGASSKGPTLTLSFELPDGGRLDRCNTAGLDRRSDPLYLLRNTVVEDLLHTRHNLKLLLGGDEYVRTFAEGRNLSFGVPGGIKDLYLFSRTDSAIIPDEAPNASVDPSMSRPGEEPDFLAGGPAPEIAPEITQEIRWLSGSSPGYNRALRTHVAEKLADASAKIVALDQQIKFLEKDFLEHPTMSKEYCDERMKHGGPLGYLSLSAICGEGAAAQAWGKDRRVSGNISGFKAAREMMLARFHLLSFEVEGARPLYQTIYRVLETQGFPSMDYVQKPIEAHLPKGEVQLPTEFEGLVHAALKRMAEPASRSRIVGAVYQKANRKVDLALIQALKWNTDFLANVSSQPSYRCGSERFECESPLLDLARYDDLWETATAKYAYLADLVDMKAARKYMNEYWNQRDARERHLRYATVGLGIGMGVVAAIAFSPVAIAGAIGVSSSSLAISASAFAIGAGLVEVTAQQQLYNSSSAVARMAEGFYNGTEHRGNQAAARGAVQLKKDDFLFLISAWVGLGLSTVQLTRIFANISYAKSLSAQKNVVLAEEDLAGLRASVAELQTAAQELSVMGRSLLSAVQRLIGVESRVVRLAEVVEEVAREMGVAASEVFKRIGAEPQLAKWAQGLGQSGEIAMKDATELRGIVAKLRRATHKFNSTGKAILVVVEKLIGKEISAGRLVRLTEAVDYLASQMKITPAEFYTRIERWDLGRILKGLGKRREIASRVMVAGNLLKQLAGERAVVPSTFYRGMMPQQLNGFVLNVISDGAARLDEIKEGHTGGFLQDMARNVIVESVLAFSGSSGNVLRAADGIVDQTKINVVGRGWEKFKRGAKELGQTGLGNAAIGIVINGSFEAVNQVYQSGREREKEQAGGTSSWERAKTVLKSAVWNAFSLGFSSTSRFAACRFIQNVIENRLLSKPDEWILVQSLWTANNLFGGYTYVSWGQSWGFIDQDGKDVDESRADLEDTDIKSVRLGELTGSYLKVTGGSEQEDYLMGYVDESATD